VEREIMWRYAMGKMTAEKVAKMLAEDGVIVTNEEATQIADFLRTLAKIAVAQYLREEEQTSHPKTENINQNTL
jgi:predicted transcriptional regulator YheO